MNTQKTALIINPVSGTGNPDDRRKVLQKVLTANNWQGKVFETTRNKGAGVRLLEAYAAGYRYAIVGGGDGTIGEALPIAVKKRIALGIIPLGTGNLLAKNLGIPLSFEEAFSTALNGRKKKIDTGIANTQFFCVMAGVGLDAATMQKTSRSMKDIFGPIAYFLTGMKEAMKKPEMYSISIDGKSSTKIYARSILVANTERIQGGIKAVPGADPKSGSFKIGILKAKTLGDWLELAGNALQGKIHKSSSYTLLTGKDVLIRFGGERRVFQCDGNDIPETDKVHITINPASLTLIVPV